jgi:hypothetical protein
MQVAIPWVDVTHARVAQTLTLLRQTQTLITANRRILNPWWGLSGSSDTVPQRSGPTERHNEAADRAVLLLQRLSELLLECRAIAQQLEVVPEERESSADAADRIAYGILVAALEEGLVRTVRDAVNVLKRFSTPAGMLGENWLSEQENKLRERG